MVTARNSNLLGKITILLMVSFVVNPALALDGSGTQEDPWRIWSLEDFNDFAADANYWDDYTKLETDVNLAGLTYTTAVIAPDIDSSNIPFDGTSFTGVFDGNDHKITNLTIDANIGDFSYRRQRQYLGLFGYIDGNVKNLGLEGGSVRGEAYVGGLVGVNSGIISKCYSIGDVNGVADVGGLVGENDESVSNCYSTGDVNGVDNVGGLVGWNEFGSVSDCYSTASVSGNVAVGGLVGVNFGSVSNCYSTGDVNGTQYWVGGLVGLNGWWFVESQPGHIYNTYSTGAVEGVLYVGGLVGYNKLGAIEKSFWDIDTSGEPNMCGLQSERATGCDPNYGKTTSEMHQQSTFTDWDFINIWNIGENQTYPYLRTYLAGDINKDGMVNFLDVAITANQWMEGVE